MTELDLVKEEISATKGELADAKEKLVQAEAAEDTKRRDRLEELLISLNNRLVELQKKENILLAVQGM